MADAAVSALFKVIFQKLGEETFKEYVRSQGILSELQNLETKLCHIQALLHDASEKEVTARSVGVWLNRLQHLAYDIDDVLDDVATEAMRHELIKESPGASTSKVRNLIVPAWYTKVSLSRRLGPRLDNINTQLQPLYTEKDHLGLMIVKNEKQKDPNRGNETSLLESGIVGREAEKEKLLNRLLGDDDESSKENFSIVPIVGMGGVGKTTLARLLYNDTKVDDHFQLKAWVCVSDDFDILKISQTIFQDVSRQSTEFKDLNQLQKALTEQFKDKQFLLVVDDVWTENYDHWEKLVRPLNSGAPGSRVIMTTRKKELLTMLGFENTDLLQSLSSKDALSLFALHALGVDSFDSYPTLREKGEAIVKKCGTLPLALKAIGRLLRTKTQEKWDDVLNSQIWNSKYVGDLSEDWKAIFPALMVSYHDLSANLKQLFAYCSLFPKDFLFNKEELVLLWMAEGFLNQSNAIKSQEEFGQEDFEALLSRSFFQHAPNDESLYVMHDLMNDLATFVAKEFYLRFENHIELGNEALAKYRHMSFIPEAYTPYQKFEPFKRARSLRTLLSVSRDQNQMYLYVSNKILVDLLPKLPLLRVLSLKGSAISEVPDLIGSLKHLRYLNLSQTSIKKLPESIGNLFNLQTLIVNGCNLLETLPKSLLKLKNLQHFDLRETRMLTKLPLGIGGLKRLQSLTEIIIGGKGGFDITELKGLNDLRGELSIMSLENVQSAMHAHEAKLSLKRLTKLELGYSSSMYRREMRIPPLEEEVLEKLKPRSEWLKELSIDYYAGREFPKWVGCRSFHQLVRVSIRNCYNCTSLPSFGHLPSLEELFIDNTNEVKFIGSDLASTKQVTVAAFPSLKILKFSNMKGWEIWSTNDEALDPVFPCLLKLEIEHCPKLMEVSLKTLPKFNDMSGWKGWLSNSEVSLLPCLRELYVTSLPKLIEFSPGKLPLLEVLKFEDMLGWEIWSPNKAVFPFLRELHINSCPKLIDVSAEELPLLRVLTIGSCGYGLLRSLVEAASSITKLYISSISGLTFEVWRGVMGHLGAVEDVTVRECNEIRCLWESEEEASKVLVNIKKLKVSNCSNLVSLGEKEEVDNFGSILWSSLRVLKVSECDNMVRCCSPNSIECLVIRQCRSLTNVSFLTTTIGGGGQNLKSLEIYWCEKLMEKINNTSMSVLESIDIRGWTHLKSIMQLGNFIYLTGLCIINCPSIESFPNIQLPVLTRLKIEGCESMESFSAHQMTTNLPLLKDLKITDCPGIDAPGIWPPNLCSLEIGRLKKPMSEWGPQNFATSLVSLRLYGEPHVSNFGQLSHLLIPSSLTYLLIESFDKLKSLSMGLEHLTSLQHLKIQNCPNMKLLSKHLTSLQHLNIWHCPKIKHLPKNLLPSLLSLTIINCPNLRKRCEGRGSHYYPLISHIPKIYIE